MMKKILTSLLIILLFSSCGVFKKKDKSVIKTENKTELNTRVLSNSNVLASKSSTSENGTVTTEEITTTKKAIGDTVLITKVEKRTVKTTGKFKDSSIINTQVQSQTELKVVEESKKSTVEKKVETKVTNYWIWVVTLVLSFLLCYQLKGSI